jgi:hypothetical protein
MDWGDGYWIQRLAICSHVAQSNPPESTVDSGSEITPNSDGGSGAESAVSPEGGVIFDCGRFSAPFVCFFRLFPCFLVDWCCVLHPLDFFIGVGTLTRFQAIQYRLHICRYWSDHFQFLLCSRMDEREPMSMQCLSAKQNRTVGMLI